MNLFIRTLYVFLAFATIVAFGRPELSTIVNAYADEAQVAQPQQGQVFEPAPLQASDHPETFTSSLFRLLPMIIVCYLVFYLMVIKPQDTKVKGHQKLMESLKRGDSLVTSGGIVGKFSGIEKGFVVLEIANNVKIRVEASHISKREADTENQQAA